MAKDLTVREDEGAAAGSVLFRVDPALAKAGRRPAFGYVVRGFLFAGVIGYLLLSGTVDPSMPAVRNSLPVVVVLLLLFLVVAVLRWFWVPGGAETGTLEVGPERVIYRVGFDQRVVEWSRIAIVRGIQRATVRQGAVLGGVWLQYRTAPPPLPWFELSLKAGLRSRPYRTSAGRQGVMLPLGLFAEREAVLAAMQRHHAAAVADQAK